MRVLFVLWLLIVAGFVPARLWPTAYVGEAPPCPNPTLLSAMPTCDGDPAWQVFVRYYTSPRYVAALDETSEEDESKISNGF